MLAYSRLSALGLGAFLAWSHPASADTVDIAPLRVGGARIDVAYDPPSDAGAFVLQSAAIRTWIETSARAVAAYYGRFPVDRLRVRIRPSDSRGVGHGTARNSGSGPEIVVTLGRWAREDALRRDWVMTHEMVHLGFPSVEERHHWMEEGLATYVEPIARARIGSLPPDQIWGDLVEGLPKGLPRDGDRGLDFTPTWGRTYWGGALFWLLADVEIRCRTDNRRGLEHALRAVIDAGGTLGHLWDVQRVLDVGGAGTGVPVLGELYRRMSADPAPVDLDALFGQLGVERRADGIHLDERAPLASVRRVIEGSSSPLVPAAKRPDGEGATERPRARKAP